MGLSESEFFALTPRKYWLLLEQHRAKQRDQQWLAGLLAATIANWSMGRPERPLQPKDFPLPLLQTRTPRKRQTTKEKQLVTQKLRSYFARKAIHTGVRRVKWQDY